MNQGLNKEVNVLDIMVIVWQGKWKILMFSIIFFIISISYILLQNKTFFNGITKIKQISELEFQEYKFLNISNSGYITREKLRDTYITQLEKREIAEQGIIKFGLLNRRDFKDKVSFEEAVISMSNSIKIMRPLQIYQTTNNDFFQLPSIQMHFYDKNKWVSFLKFIHTETNEKVRVILKERFKSYLFALEKTKQIKIEDIKYKINNMKNLQEKKLKIKIAFLEDQYEIARTAGIKKNNNFYYKTLLQDDPMEDQYEFARTAGIKNNNYFFFQNLLQDDLYYLRGYLVIEKEIELIKRRKAIFWSETLFNLEKQLDYYKNNSYIEKSKSLFESLSVQNETSFKAVIFEPEKTQFIFKNTNRLIVILSIILGSIFGFFYVLINALFIRNMKLTKNT